MRGGRERGSRTRKEGERGERLGRSFEGARWVVAGKASFFSKNGRETANKNRFF